MPSGILIFEIRLLVTELVEGQACDPKALKDAMTTWWDDPEAPRRTPEEACLGAWACITDHLVANKSHPRVQCSEVSLETSGHKVKFRPTEDTWSELYV